MRIQLQLGHSHGKDCAIFLPKNGVLSALVLINVVSRTLPDSWDLLFLHNG